MKRLFFLTIFTATATAAEASEIPRYDVAGHFQEVAGVSGGSAMIYNSCVDMEQTAYDGLKYIWSNIPSGTRAHCADIARISGGSYSILESCIEMETSAAGNQSTFKC